MRIACLGLSVASRIDRSASIIDTRGHTMRLRKTNRTSFFKGIVGILSHQNNRRLLPLPHRKGHR